MGESRDGWRVDDNRETGEQHQQRYQYREAVRDFKSLCPQDVREWQHEHPEQKPDKQESYSAADNLSHLLAPFSTLRCCVRHPFAIVTTRC